MTPTDALFLTPSWTRDDIAYVRDMCNELKIDPAEFFAIPTIESWLNPAYCVPKDDGKVSSYVAVGLVQFTRIVAVQYKWILPTEDDKNAYKPWADFSVKFHKMTVKEQLPYIKEFLTPFSKKYDIARSYKMYQVFAASSSLEYAKELSDIIYAEGTPGYEGNKGLDINKEDGGITVNDLRLAIEDAKTRDVYKAIVSRLQQLG